MEGLDQVSDDTGCWIGLTLQVPRHVVAKASSRAEDARQGRLVRIARTIEGEVIPRLLLAHSVAVQPTGTPIEAVVFDAHTVERFSRLVLEGEDEAPMREIRALIAGGFPLESVYLDLLAPAAQWLGRQWEEDALSFSDVTVGLARLQRVMRRLSSPATDPAHRGEREGSVLLAAMPGDDHMFGVLMLEEFCRRDGLMVECLPVCSRADLLQAVRRADPAVVGLSISVDEKLGELTALVRDVRAASGRPGMGIMVGGRCFNERPELVAAVGADFTAVDGREAIGQIHRHLSKQAYSQHEP